MRRILFLCTSMLGIMFSSIAQVNSRDRAIIERVLGNQFSQIQTESDYFSFLNCTHCISDSSLIFTGRTDGATFKNEYVLYHNPISFKRGEELLKYLRSNPVTVEEYIEFEKWVRDSTAMENYFQMIDEPNYNAKFMIRDKKKVYYRNGQEVPVGYMYREDIRPDISFDHTHMFHYDDPEIVPFVAYLYLPYPQRFYKQRIFDKRKFYYRYNAIFEKLSVIPYDSITSFFPQHLSSSTGFGEIELTIPVMRNEFALSAMSEHYRDLPAVYSIAGDKMFNELAAYGLKGFQADAFCDWKSKMLQRELYNAGLDYVVVVTLPTEEDVEKVPLLDTAIQLPERNTNDQWQITNREYREFVSYVRDSIDREYLYYNLRSDYEASKLLSYLDYYFGEGELEYVEFDWADRDLNRELFPFDPKRKIKHTPEVDSLMAISEKLPLSYSYMEYNAANHAIEGSLIQNIRFQEKNGNEFGLKKIKSNIDSIPYAKIGKDLLIGSVNLLGDANAIRSHADYNRFIDRKTIALNVSHISDIPEDDNIRTSLGYEEALAYYNWRYPIQQATKASNWQDFIYPSEGQYKAIIEGKTWISPPQTISYPSPLFRYAAHIYPKVN